MKQVKAMAAKGEDLNDVIAANGATALHVAASNGYKDIMAYLLRCKGIDIEAIDHEGNTPLHTAVQFEEYPCVMQLAMSGANIHARNFLNQTPIVMTENETLLRILQAVDQKAD